jgi:preprotein translocase subunit SecD
MQAGRRASRLAVLMLLLVLGAACSSGSSKTSTPTTGAGSVKAKARLEFRAVRASATGIAGNPCSAFHLGPVRSVFSDRSRMACYALGSVLLTGADIGSTTVVYDPRLEAWTLRFRWTNDEFRTKVARPLAGRRFAAVLNGVVLSAPTLTHGFSGRDLEIARFTRADAIAYAAAIMGIPRSAVPVAPKPSN